MWKPSCTISPHALSPFNCADAWQGTVQAIYMTNFPGSLQASGKQAICLFSKHFTCSRLYVSTSSQEHKVRSGIYFCDWKTFLLWWRGGGRISVIFLTSACFSEGLQKRRKIFWTACGILTTLLSAFHPYQLILPGSLVAKRHMAKVVSAAIGRVEVEMLANYFSRSRPSGPPEKLAACLSRTLEPTSITKLVACKRLSSCSNYSTLLDIRRKSWGYYWDFLVRFSDQQFQC